MLTIGEIENDLQKLEMYRNDYMFSGQYSLSENNKADLKYILRFWENNKENLYNLLGHQIILKEEEVREYTKPKRQLENEICDLRFSEINFIQYFTKICISQQERFMNLEDFYDFKSRMFPSRDEAIDQWVTINLFNSEVLATNRYDAKNMYIKKKDGKILKIETGMKIMKILKQLGKEFDIDSSRIEDFRNEHSVILNQKKIKGRFCLSIHPLDYWTMSDNEEDWTSCMSWREDGEYSQGTIEMMNSPCVVVGYIESLSNKMSIDKIDDWNSKKWRQLFIVDKNCITGVKGYPYENEELTKFFITWLKELAEKNLNWQYNDEMFYCENDGRGIKINDKSMIYFYTNKMYNDFGLEKIAKMAFISKDLNDKNENINISYSGESECMCCGMIEDDMIQENRRVCTDCSQEYTCSNCGEAWDIDEMYCMPDGSYICPDCFYDVATQECIGEEYDYIDNLVPIRVVSSIHCDDEKHVLEMVSDLDKEFYIYPNDLEVFKKNFLKKDKKVYQIYGHTYWGTYNSHYFIYLEDLIEEEALEDYSIYISTFNKKEYEIEEVIKL